MNWFLGYTVMRIVVELFLAGTDTSSTTMTWAMLLMTAHPDIQKKCRDEIKKVITFINYL